MNYHHRIEELEQLLGFPPAGIRPRGFTWHQWKMIGVLSKVKGVASREYLIRCVWDELDKTPDERTVDVHIARINRVSRSHGYGFRVKAQRHDGYFMTVEHRLVVQRLIDQSVQ